MKYVCLVGLMKSSIIYFGQRMDCLCGQIELQEWGGGNHFERQKTERINNKRENNLQILTTLVSHNEHSGTRSESFGIENLNRDEILCESLKICYFVALKNGTRKFRLYFLPDARHNNRIKKILSTLQRMKAITNVYCVMCTHSLALSSSHNSY